MFIAAFILWEDFNLDDFAFASEEAAEPPHEKYKAMCIMHSMCYQFLCCIWKLGF